MIKTNFRVYIIYIFFLSISFLPYSSIANKSVIIKKNEYVETEVPFFNEQGEKIFLDKFEGQTVLLVFWATWCSSCVDEMSYLDNLQKDFRKLPFKILAVSQDYQGIKVIKDFFNKNEIRHLEISHDYQNKLFRSMGATSLPLAYLINSSGKTKIMFKGMIKWHEEKIREMILAEMDSNPEMPKNTYKAPVVNMNKSQQKKQVLEPNEAESKKEESKAADNNKNKDLNNKKEE